MKKEDEEEKEATADGDWWCPKCQSYVSGETVTYEEFHEPCGAYLGGSVQEDHHNAIPPPPGLAGIDRDQLAHTIWSNGYPPQVSDAGRCDVVTVDPGRLADAILARLAESPPAVCRWTVTPMDCGHARIDSSCGWWAEAEAAYIPDDFKFCPYCGKPIEEAENEQ
jgi:hypothetical protein